MSTATTFDMPEDIPEAGGAYLTTPGTYHVVITEVKDGEGPKGNAIAGFTMDVHILAGTVPDAVGKRHTECVFDPKLNAKDGGLFQRQQHAALYIAGNLVDPSKRGQKVEINRAQLQDQQLIIKLDKDTHNSTEEKTFLRISGVNIYHVDDPRVEKIPKDTESLKLIDAKYRHDKAWFDQLIKKKDSSASASGSGGSGSGKSSSGTGANVNLDDL